MRAGILVAGLAWCVAVAAPASAQQQPAQRFTGTTQLTPNRDVILEIPELPLIRRTHRVDARATSPRANDEPGPAHRRVESESRKAARIVGDGEVYIT